MQTQKLTEPLAYHLVARALFPYKPFLKQDVAVSVWMKLTAAFPPCIAAVLMPDHVHLIVKNTGVTPQTLRRRLQPFFAGKKWEPIPEPRAIPDRHHLRRQVRYVHLNPCRKSLCADPIAWEWSTHRDYMGATIQPWPEVPSALGLLDFSTRSDGRAEFHRYVSADPTVNPVGTHAPATPRRPLVLDIAAVEKAAEMICRQWPGRFHRKGTLRAQLMHLLHTEFNLPKVAIAKHFGVHWTAVKPPQTPASAEAWVKPLLLTLSDHRLMPPQPASLENVTSARR